MRNTYESAVRTQIHQFLVSLSGETQFSCAENLVELGILQSIHVLECIHFLTHTFAIDIAAEDLFAGRLTSVDGMVALVSSRTRALSAVPGGAP